MEFLLNAFQKLVYQRRLYAICEHVNQNINELKENVKTIRKLFIENWL